MKIPFITGGDKCECGGEGTLNREVSLGTRILIIRTVCHCVRAKEATVEELVDHGVHKTIERSGSVVPKEE